MNFPIFPDIRERFYYVVLVLLVALRNMHELQWDLGKLSVISTISIALFTLPMTSRNLIQDDRLQAIWGQNISQ